MGPATPLAAPVSTPDATRDALCSVVDDLRRLMQGRRSIRRYHERPVDRSVLGDILNAASWAPSAHNRQPWRFCAVTNSDVKHHLSAVMGERWAEDLRADGEDAATIERRIAISRARMTGAAALIAVSLSMEEMDVYADERRREAERTMAVQSTALACQNLLLAAHAHGLGACWMCAPLFAPDLVRQTLELPESWQPQALITLGYPAEERVSERAPIASRVIWR